MTIGMFLVIQGGSVTEGSVKYTTILNQPHLLQMIDFHKALIAVFCVLLLASCGNTKLSNTWSAPGITESYSNIMIVGIADSEQLRRAYEAYFSDHLMSRGVQSIASYTLIDHKSMMKLSDIDMNNFRNIVQTAAGESGVDAVLMTHLVAVDEEDIYRPDLTAPTYGPVYYSTTYYDNMHGYHAYVTNYVTQAGYYSHEYTYTLETNLYDVKTEDLVWTTRSQTFGIESTDDAIMELTDLITSDLVSRGIIR
jgi:hypothetical protein